MTYCRLEVLLHKSSDPYLIASSSGSDHLSFLGTALPMAHMCMMISRSSVRVPRAIPI